MELNPFIFFAVPLAAKELMQLLISPSEVSGSNTHDPLRLSRENKWPAVRRQVFLSWKWDRVFLSLRDILQTT